MSARENRSRSESRPAIRTPSSTCHRNGSAPRRRNVGGFPTFGAASAPSPAPVTRLRQCSNTASRVRANHASPTAIIVRACSEQMVSILMQRLRTGIGRLAGLAASGSSRRDLCRRVAGMASSSSRRHLRASLRLWQTMSRRSISCRSRCHRRWRWSLLHDVGNRDVPVGSGSLMGTCMKAARSRAGSEPVASHRADIDQWRR